MPLLDFDIDAGFIEKNRVTGPSFHPVERAGEFPISVAAASSKVCQTNVCLTSSGSSKPPFRFRSLAASQAWTANGRFPSFSEYNRSERRNKIP